jgi:hypothetical protein
MNGVRARAEEQLSVPRYRYVPWRRRISFVPCCSRRRVPLGEPPRCPGAPKKEIQPPLGIKERVLRGFGISAHTPVLFGGEALSPGGLWFLPYDQKCFAAVRGLSRRSRCHPPRSATSRAIRDP